MTACGICGEEHEFLDPTFRRPEAYVRLDDRMRSENAQADDNLCRISFPGEPSRHFVRGVLPVPVPDRPDGLMWGLWAEVSEAAFRRVLELWSAPDQSSEPPFDAELANVIPSYRDTLGLPMRVFLTGPTSRPRFEFDANVHHPFVEECQRGVTGHRAAEWNKLIEEG
jgi:hypothetical protein